jgi:hypothetical protein
MKNLFQPEVLDEVVGRINSITTSSNRQWGKMDAGQMCAHCVVGLEAALGEKVIKRNFISYLIGPIFKRKFLNGMALPKNSQTAKEFKILDAKVFAEEQRKLIEKVKQFSQGGPTKVTTKAHGFFGFMEPEEWAKLTYMHLDHHLRQFNA